jgi:pimeloyl-ACP methyl ester carboxylesterase
VAVLELERPIVVGHSMSAGLAFLYAAEHATRGVVAIDTGPDVEPFAQLAQQLEPALRGPGFTDVWQTYESTLGLEQIPEPTRSLVLATHEVDQDVVLGYWDMMLRTDPAELQAWIDTELAKVDVPCLGVFGRLVTDRERTRMDRLPEMQLEEWVGDGHFVHLVDPDRFAGRLSKFIDHCTSIT